MRAQVHQHSQVSPGRGIEVILLGAAFVGTSKEFPDGFVLEVRGGGAVTMVTKCRSYAEQAIVHSRIEADESLLR